MSDKLMPTMHDGGLPANLTGESDDLGIPGIPSAPIVATQSKSKVSGQVVLAGAVLLLAGGAIYGMRFVGLNAAFGGDDIKVDYTAEKGLESAKRFERVMAELDASMSAVQNRRGWVAWVIFVQQAGRREVEEPGVYNEPTDLDDLDRLARLAAERRQREIEERMQLIQGELSRLNVQGIIGGRIPAARINGQPVSVGQQLGVFEVVEITGKGVIVQVDGDQYELRIGMPPRAVE